MATRGSGDIDHCLMDLMNRLNPNQRSRPNLDQMSGTAGSSSNQLGHQQGMDWSNYPHPSQMFASPPSTVTQQSQSSPSAIGNQAWMQAPVYDPPSPQTRGSHGGGNSDGGDVNKQGLYTQERAESILATLGLSNEDLGFPSQYPEDQLNPDNVSFILRFLQVNTGKSKSQNSAASPSYSQSASRGIHDTLPPPARSLPSTGRLRSQEVPRYHSVPQAAGKVIDYGQASQATDDSSGRETSKRDPASSEGKVHETDMPERLHIRLQPFESNKHVDLDYCRSSDEVHKNTRLSPAKEFLPLYTSRHPDREYSRYGPRPSPSSETWNDYSSSSRVRHPVLKSHGTTKRSTKRHERKNVSTQKKMKKVSSQSTPSCTAACLVYLTGIPTTATEQEVNTWVRDFGKYNNVVLLSGSEADQGQKASVCMEREEDALALAQCSSLSIGDQPITATLAKKPEADDSTAVSKGTSSQELSAIGGEDSGNGPELVKKTSEEEFSSNSTVLITGLPESGWTESDVIKLCQPFGAPSDIILATQSGKALLLMPDVEMAEEMVKNHSVAPMKINDSELKMTNLELAISLNTPVALYNLLNQSKDTFEVPWNRLLVIRNLPDTPTASSEVQSLVERIEKVHNILVLNHNMILCEMLTAGAVVRVRNHYHRFPCIIQSNPLYFTSWRDPIDQNLVWGPHWLPPWLTASLYSFKESPDDDKDNHTVPTVDKEDSILQENEKCDYLEKLYYAGTVIGFHCKLCDSRIETTDALSIDPIHIDAHLKGNGHKLLSRQNEKYVEEDNKNINLRRFYCHLCKCYMDDLKCKFMHLKGRKHIASMMKNQLDYKRARKVKKGKLRDETGEKTSSKDDAAGKAASKERKSEDQQDIKVGEELSNAAPTQVCHPETDVKTDKIKVSLFKQPEESKHMNTSLEGLDKETSSSSAPVDGGVSSSKHAEHPKESPADDKDSHTVPTADKEDSTPQENETSVPGEKEKTVKMDNRNAEGHAKISGEDEYVEEIYHNGRDRLHCKLCNGIFNKGSLEKEQHLKGRRHTISLQLLGQKSEKDEYFEEVRDPKGKLVRLHCKLCKCNIQLNNKESHLTTKLHKRILELKRDFDAKKLKEGELRDDTDEKTSSKDEDRQNIKESPAHDKDSHTVPTADKEVSTPQQNDYLVDICYDGTAIDFFCTLCESPLNSRDAIYVDTHLNGEIHNKLLSLNLYLGEKREDQKIEIFSQDECIVEVNLIMTLHKPFFCYLCKSYINHLRDKYIHLKGKKHIASLWKKLKESKLKDDTDEKISSKDEAAGKQLRKDQQDIKVGEELSKAAHTQVCNPEADVKTDNAISLQLLVENSKLDEYVEEVHNRDGRVVLLSCKLCKCSIKANAKDEHLKSETHARRLELKCYLDVKKPTGGQLRDNTEEKINSNAALTQVCEHED